MTPRTIVLSLALVIGFFTYYGFSIAEKIENDFLRSSDHFAVVTNVLSPMFDNCAINIVSGQVKLAHNQIDFKVFCKSMQETRENIKKYLEKYKETKTDKEDKGYQDLAIQLEKVDLYLEKALKACELNDQKSIYEMLNSGEMYSIVDPTVKVINKVLDDKLLFAENSRDHTVKILSRFKYFLTIQLCLAFVISLAVLIPKKKKSKTKKIV